MVEIDREPGVMEDRGTADSPALPFREERAKTVVLGRVIPGGGRVLVGDRQVVEIWTVRMNQNEERSGARVGYDSLSKNVLELFGMVWTAYVMIVIKKDLPRREGEAVLMRCRTGRGSDVDSRRT